MMQQIPILAHGTDALFLVRLKRPGQTVVVQDTDQATEHSEQRSEIELSRASNISVTLRREMSTRVISVPYKVEGDYLVVEFPAPMQSRGLWEVTIVCDVPESALEDKLMRYTITQVLCHIDGVQQVLANKPIYYIDAQAWAIAKGDKGETGDKGDRGEKGEQGIPGTPGDPTELLETLSQQQTQQIGEVAARLSSEQANALALQSDRLSREQADALEQQAERLSSEQRQQVANSMGNIYSEQENKLEEMRLKNQEAVDSLATLRQEQSQFLFDFSQEQQQKVDNALERIPSSINTEVDRHRPQIKDGYWWVGDEYTGVLAEAKRLSTEEWLILNKLTIRHDVVANYIIRDPKYRYGAQDICDLYHEKIEPYTDDKHEHLRPGIWRNEALRGRGTGHNTRVAYLVEDLSQYGKNIIIRLSIEINSGSAAMYWLEGEQWQSVAAAATNEQPVMTLSASITHPTGHLVLITDSPRWGIVGRINVIDIYSTSDEQIDAPVVTWLGKPRNPSKGDVILVSNIASRGERIRLEYDGTDWALPWGAVIRGNSTNDARQSYTQAILSRLLRPEPIR